MAGVALSPSDPNLGSVAWAAAQLGVSVSQALRLAAIGELPGAFKVGRYWRVSKIKFNEAIHGQGAA